MGTDDFPLRSVLIIEDEAIIALDLTDIFEALGCRSAVVANVESARTLLASQTFHAAALDMNLSGQSAAPLADELLVRDVPFIITTGYEALEMIPAQHLDAPIVRKPFVASDIEAAMARAFVLHVQRKLLRR